MKDFTLQGTSGFTGLVCLNCYNWNKHKGPACTVHITQNKTAYVGEQLVDLTNMIVKCANVCSMLFEYLTQEHDPIE